MRRIISFTTIITLILIAILAFTRIVGLDWGLPYSMHPDERNMVIAIQHMRCMPGSILSCFDPDFFAYGQLPLYAAYILSLIISYGSHFEGFIRSEVVTLALRIISATSSIVMSVYLVKIIDRLHPLRFLSRIMTYLLVIFVPVFIQFAHFGTTESLLMMFVVLMLYLSLRLFEYGISLSRYVTLSGILFGLAVGTKVSAALFAIIPAFTILSWFLHKRTPARFGRAWFGLIKVAALGILFFIIASPFNILDWNGFIHSMNYESSVGIGTYKAFYTRSFEYTVPLIFQFVKILPYTLGWPMLIASILGFIFLPWNRTFNLLRVSLVVLFLINAPMYAKWTRFIAPAFPIFVMFGSAFIVRVMNNVLHRGIRSILFPLIVGVVILPGIAFLAIYQTPDVRFVASDWMYENIAPNSKILAETANVVDVPIPSRSGNVERTYYTNLHPISFDFYDLDQNSVRERELSEHLKTVDYIFVPSRRIFWNHTCYIPISNFQFQISKYDVWDGFESDRCQKLRDQYPLLNAYYDGLFDGSLGFEQVATFSSFPRIELFGKTILSFPDEAAEETWTVFDHPVVRVYKRL